MSEFDGTVIFISHDRYLLNKVPDKIIEITKSGAVVYDGNYEYYKEKALDVKPDAEEKKQPVKKKSEGTYRSKEQRKADVAKKNKIRELENEISYLEKRISEIEQEMASEEVYTSFELMQEKSIRLEEANNRLEECFEEWEELSS